MAIKSVQPDNLKLDPKTIKQKKSEKLANDFEQTLTKELMKDLYEPLKKDNVIYDSLIVDEYVKILAPKTGMAKKVLPFILRNNSAK